jgi:CDP-diacylglycerol--glycerol-3-phosphate 3-phosphatidyltransferase
LFDGRFRATVESGVRPIGSRIVRTGVSADHLTATGLVLAAACAVTLASGHLGWGVVLLAASSLPDLLDGAVAKAAGTASPRGAFFDSVADRVSDSLVLGGLAWHLAGTWRGYGPSGLGSHAAVLPFAVLAASNLVSYQRARAESLGYTARGGLMERAERVIALGFGLLFSAILLPVLEVMLALTMVTAVQRFAKVWRQASAPRTATRAPARPAASRWRAWQATVRSRPGRTTRAGRRGATTTAARWLATRAERTGAGRTTGGRTTGGRTTGGRTGAGRTPLSGRGEAGADGEARRRRPGPPR